MTGASSTAPDTRCGFVVLAHHKPQQALRLIDRLRPAPIFLHVDRGADPAVHRHLAEGAALREWVTALPRSRSAWASWGQVEAALAGLRAAHDRGLSHAVILSGQDYPLVAPSEIATFCHRHQGTSFVPYWPLPSALWGAAGGMERLRHWHRPIRSRRFRIPISRRLPRGLAPYGGASWFMLARPAIGDLLRFVAGRPDAVRFYRHAWTPDEMFIHTALLNSPSAPDIVNENLWFVQWTANAKHPAVLTAGDAPALLEAAARSSSTGGEARAKLFARKFDSEADAEILDILDRRPVPA
jgi:Core-2/I-Branching enzyme